MKKFLISLLLGVSMVTMAGCGNANKEVADTNVEQNEREGAYPNFQDKEVEEPIGLSKEDKEEKAVEAFNNNFADINSSRASESEVEYITFCYVYDGTIHVYDFMDYTNSNNYTNEDMATSMAMYLDKETLSVMLETAELIMNHVDASFTINGLDLNDYEIRYHNCIGNPHDETFYEMFVSDEDGSVLELFGEAIN